MYSYLIRRLLPFFVVAVAAESLELIIVSVLKHAEMDLSFLVLVKTSGVLFLTTIVSFFYLMLPYVFYLLFLPAEYRNSKFDRIVTTAGYSLFVFFCLMEESLSVWLIYTKNTKLLIEDNNTWESILQMWLILWNNWHVFTAIVFLSLAVIILTVPYLFTSLPAPKFGQRLYHTALYVLICVLAYVNIDINQLKINANQINRVVSEEGSYYLIKTINEREIVPALKKIRLPERK